MDRPLMAVAGHQGEHQITTPMEQEARESPKVRENPRYLIMVAEEVAVTNHLMVVAVVLIPVTVVRLTDPLDHWPQAKR